MTWLRKVMRVMSQPAQEEAFGVLKCDAFAVLTPLSVPDAPQVEIVHSLAVPQEGQYLKLECVSKGNPL